MKIEGKNAVAEAINAGTTIDRLIVQKGLSDPSSQKIIDSAKSRAIKIFFRDKQHLDRESVTGRHQGFVAEVTDYKYTPLENVLQSTQNQKDALILILDGIEDPHNLGSIIRVAECSGVSGVVIPKHRAVSVNETVIKVSSGAASHVAVSKVTNVNDSIKLLKDNGFWIYAADLGGQSLYQAKLSGKIALVVGGEGNGVKQLTRKLCDDVLTIPMFGQLNSLNASVACGIVVYEILRQR
ncbi:MAG: 23S rRNA (guanosine(2251)-2'-O)-methyltransferase RlmB [Firmicutes bacterium]|nr:23S rRNA (guanosine(2251)-2'-O)-methyltransferase RlmB [Bacillota bacterium]MCL1953144.1 23S rRNA (guanosine(2251)-2'-O)-methyltransferase RlmB [Bacillota bacterium]